MAAPDKDELLTAGLDTLPSLDDLDRSDFIEVPGSSFVERAKDVRWIFLRPEAKQLFEVLNGDKNVIVTGPPGTGKSILCWLWVCYQLKSGKSVLLISPVADDVVSFYLISMSDGNAQCTPCDGDALMKAKRKYDIVFADGASKANHLLGMAIVLGRSFIVAASLQLPSADKAVNLDLWNAVHFSMYGWILEDIVVAATNANVLQRAVEKNALREPTLGDEEALKGIIEEKFYYAGHNIRNMLEFSVETVCSDVSSSIGYLTGDATDVGDRSTQAVNTLFTRFRKGLFDNVVCPVSKYVSYVLLLRDMERLSRVLNSTSFGDNPAIKGWYHEFAFLMKVKRGLGTSYGHTLYSLRSEDDVHLPPGVGIYSYKFGERLTLDEGEASDGADGVWIFPQMWNQGLFDLAWFEQSTGELILIQLTVATTHTFKFKFAIQLRAALNAAFGEGCVRSLKIFVVLPFKLDFRFVHSQVYSDRCGELEDLLESRFTMESGCLKILSISPLGKRKASDE